MNTAETKTVSNSIEAKITAIKVAVNALSPQNEYLETISTLNGMAESLQAQLTKLQSTKEYMIQFTEGGWNTLYALDDDEALKLAKAEYNSSQYTQVESVYLTSKNSIADAMRTFY